MFYDHSCENIVNDLKKNKFTASESNEITSFLEQAFVRLEAWFQWFNTTQSGKEIGSYCWHGRDNTATRELNPKTLSSGLDDNPRASHPSEDERHLDLRCWMLLAADCMDSIRKLFEMEKTSAEEYGSTAKLLSDFATLNQKHFNQVHGAYFDFGNHTEKVQLSWTVVKAGNNHPRTELNWEVSRETRVETGSSYWICQPFPLHGKNYSTCRNPGFWESSLTSSQTRASHGQIMDSVLFPKQAHCT
ncbi:hypothetical protein SLE2022_047910 [Rubroshorea leprosula]